MSQTKEKTEKNTESITLIPALFQKYSWLSEVIDQSIITQVKILYLSYDVFYKDSGYYCYEGDEKLDNTIFLFSPTGYFLGQVGAKKKDRKFLFYKWISINYFRETVHEAILRMEKETGMRVHYITGLVKDTHKEGWHLLFSAPPKGKNLHEVFSEGQTIAQETLEEKLKMYS